MKHMKRNLVLSILVISVLVLQSIALVVDAAAPGSTWYVIGYVKKSGTTTPISGARVQIINDGVYLGQVYTSSSGYFSFSTTRRPTNYEGGWQVTISKSGYMTVDRFATPVDYTTNLGTTYMNIVPPPPPPTPAVISNVNVATGGNALVTISWDVDWDDTSTGYLSKCWWSSDSSMDAGDLFFSTTTKQASYSVTVPEYTVPLTGGTRYYQIYARNSKNGYYPETYYGPASVVLDGLWRMAPTDDAYTVEEDYGGNYNTGTLYCRDYDMYYRHAWFKFDVEYPSLVAEATLFAMVYSTYPNGYGSISAYSTDSDWDEHSITEEYAPLSLYHLLDTNAGASSGQLVAWDVTTLFSSENIVAIALIGDGGQNTGAGYYSKEYSVVSYRPYLLIEYYGKPEAPPTGINTQFNDFETDDFANPEMNPIWHHTTTPIAPTWNPAIQLGIVGGEERGALSFTQTPLDNTDLRGHYYYQDNLYIKGPFSFQVELGWAFCIYEQSYLIIGLELYGPDNEIVADLYYEYHGGSTDFSSIKGGIGNSADIAVNPCELSPGLYLVPVILDAMLEINRDANNVVDLIYHRTVVAGEPYINPLTITSEENDAPISRLRLKVEAKRTGTNGGMGCWFDSVREIKTIALGDPYDTYAPFNIPIIDREFNGPTIVGWKDEVGATPGGHASSDYSVQENGNSWWLSIDRANCELRQELTEGAMIRHNSIEGQYLSFSFWAHRSTYDVRMRAAIEYQVSGDLEPTVVLGDWAFLDSSSDDGYEISVTTDYPIPAGLAKIVVRIIGRSTDPYWFNAYIDEARLSIIRPCFDDLRNHYFGYLEDEILCGVSTYSLGVIHASKPDNWLFIIVPTVIAQAADGFKITGLQLKITVDGSIADKASVVGDQVIESNDKKIEPIGLKPAPWAEAIPLIKDGTKWGMRFALLSSGYGAPFSWLISDAVNGIEDYILEPYARDADAVVATPGRPGLINLDYNIYYGIEVAQCSTEILWDVSSATDYPVDLTITFYVEWDHPLYDGLFISHHSMRVTFCPNVY